MLESGLAGMVETVDAGAGAVIGATSEWARSAGTTEVATSIAALDVGPMLCAGRPPTGTIVESGMTRIDLFWRFVSSF